MKIKLGQLQTIDMTLAMLMFDENQKPVKLPVKTAYFFTKFIKQLRNEIVQFNESRLQICERYCNRDKDGNPIIENEIYQFTVENIEKQQKEFNDLAETEIEIPFNAITIEELGDIQIAPPVLEMLDHFGLVTLEEV